MEHMNPRTARVVALPKPTERETDNGYFQRYIQQFPSGGEVCLFDRSWVQSGRRPGTRYGFLRRPTIWNSCANARDRTRMIVRSGHQAVQILVLGIARGSETPLSSRAGTIR